MNNAKYNTGGVDVRCDGATHRASSRGELQVAE